MTHIVKPDISRAWANNGAVVKPSDASIDVGWIAEKPPFQTENWIQNRADVYLQHLEERGTPEWDALVIYSNSSLCYYQKQVWTSLQDSNLNNTPSAGAGFWIPLQELSSPPAIVISFAGSAAPAGWLLCDGQTISRATFARLFSFIGEVFGAGDGSTTFEIPNLVDKVPVGAGTTVVLGANIGNKTETISISNMPAHDHGGGDHTHGYVASLSAPNNAQGSNNPSARNDSNLVTDPSGSIIQSQGSGIAMNNMQPSLGMNWIIKT